MIDEVRAECPALERRRPHRHADVGRARVDGAVDAGGAGASVPATLRFDDPINIQYTSGTTGFPKGATLSHHNILNNGFFVGEPARLHRGRPGLRAGALLPLLRHGDGQPRRAPRTARRSSSRRPAFDPAATLAGGAGRAVHVALRRADDVHRRARPCPTSRDYDLSSLRTGIMAGSPCPVEVMKQVIDRDAHGRGDDLLRHDRDLAGVDADPAPTTTLERRVVDRRARACPHVEVKVVDPETRPDRCRAASRASCAPAATR